MAAVTVNTLYVNVIGSRRQMLFNVTGTTGDTLVTGLNTVQQVNPQPSGTNDPSAISASGGTLTFTSGGAFTVNVEVIGN